MTQEPKPDGAPLRAALISIYDIVALGLRSIHSALEKAGHECDLVLFRNKIETQGFRKLDGPPGNWPTETEYELLRDLFVERKPRAVGIGLRSFAFETAKRITAIAREAADPLVVWGGIHPTLMPGECIETADVVCVGEGEGPMVDIMEALAAGEKISDIPNLWVRDGQDIVRNPPRPLIQDLDSLPFPVTGNRNKYTIDQDMIQARDDYLGSDSKFTYCLAGSRGCPFNCDYCGNSALRKVYKGLGSYVRKRSCESVLAEIEHARSLLEINGIAFQDEIFSHDREWGLRFLLQYRERIGLPFMVSLHPKTIDAGSAALFRETGLASAHFGVQSGSERCRREYYHRPETNQDVLNAAMAFKKLKTMTIHDFIFDNPYEDEEDLKQTLELMLALPRPHNLNLLSLCFFPRTRITERALADGVITEDQVDHLSKKSFTHIWANVFTSMDRKNAFYITLAWMETLKFDMKNLAWVFFCHYYGACFHLFPRWFIRLVSRSRILLNRPMWLYRPLMWCISAANRFLKVPRYLRSRTASVRGRFFRFKGFR